MSYWTFTDIFEENGPVPSPFHGGFGLVNFQGLRKPAFYAYQFLNRLGNVELASGDPDSWACRDARGVQILFWNYTPPATKESNQRFFTRDLPAKDFGPVRILVNVLPPGAYQMNVYRVGYGVNDVYTAYLKLGSPPNLSLAQVRALADQNDGRAVSSRRVRVTGGRAFVHDVLLRENEVYLITLERQASR
jgi:xylan 1,4-beta-xylosidase